MKFPITMLHDFVSTRLSAEEVGDLLTMAGFELEGIETVEGDPVLDIKVVSNRGDGLSVFGLSREVLAKDLEARPTELYDRVVGGYQLGDESAVDCRAATSVRIETNACSRFGCRIMNSVSNSDSPDWMQKRLRQAGLRPLGILVDLSNYVMLELGQPLHAYDFATLAERRIVVRGAQEGEPMTTLNGLEHKLKPHHMVIADASRAIGVAGVMGGLDTEVSDSTSEILIEAAHFVNTSVRKTRKELGLSTDASYRFERSVDPEGVIRAINRYADLLKQAQPGANLMPGVVDEFPRPPAKGQVAVRVSRATKLLGMSVTSSEVRTYLERLGFSVSGEGEPYLVQSPSWRPDIVREEDLIEEIGRIHGYERIPCWAPHGSSPIGGPRGLEKARDDARNALLRCGLVQTISHSLRDLHPLDSPFGHRVGPRNPGSPEMAYLRNSLLPCLCDAALRNGGRNVHLFEIGRVHSEQEGERNESIEVAILSTGELIPDHWQKSASPNADFFSLKGVLESAAGAIGRSLDLQQPSQPDPRLHPTRQARIYCSRGIEGGIMAVPLGFVGQLHPDAASACDLPAETVVGWFDLEAAYKTPRGDGQLVKLSRNPAVRRDISVLISKFVPFSEIQSKVQDSAGSVLEKMWLFDVYEGKGIDPGFHSLSIALQLRKPGENFTDEEANQVRDAVVAALESLGGVLR